MGALGVAAAYPDGTETPSGSTAFALPSARFTFRSTAYAWLVVDGDVAYLRGQATMNGGADAAGPWPGRDPALLIGEEWRDATIRTWIG